MGQVSKETIGKILHVIESRKTVHVLVRYGWRLYEILAFNRQKGTFKSR